MGERKRSAASSEAACAWGEISACERIPRPPSRTGREMMEEPVGRERGEEQRVGLVCWKRESS
jgi:hypothetical protein